MDWPIKKHLSFGGPFLRRSVGLPKNLLWQQQKSFLVGFKLKQVLSISEHFNNFNRKTVYTCFFWFFVTTLNLQNVLTIIIERELAWFYYEFFAVRQAGTKIQSSRPYLDEWLLWKLLKYKALRPTSDLICCYL